MQDKKFLIRIHPKRFKYKKYLKNNVPAATFVEDTTNNAMNTFMKALELAGDSACLHMEDDIIFCNNFLEKVNNVIQQKPDCVVNFFSMRKKDLEVGTRCEPGRTFMFGQCFYLPAGLSKNLLDYEWEKIKIHPTGLDLMVADFLKDKKLKYWIHVPNLVQHREEKSVINPRRSSKRLSLTFKYD